MKYALIIILKVYYLDSGFKYKIGSMYQESTLIVTIKYLIAFRTCPIFRWKSFFRRKLKQRPITPYVRDEKQRIIDAIPQSSLKDSSLELQLCSKFSTRRGSKQSQR